MPGTLPRLRETLVAEGYTDAGLAAALGGTAGFGLAAFDPAIVARRLPGGPLGDLVILFMLGGSVRRKRAERLFGRKPCLELEQAGLLSGDSETVRAEIAIHAWGELLLACDRHDTATRADHVVGVTPAAATLAHLTVRPAGAETLDLGTGCGVEALLAVAHSERVTATDVNPRAIEFAAMNLRLNGIGGVDLAAGSWFEPVAARCFDLVVCNPPFVISPDTTLVYRDGEEPGDGVSRRVVQEAAAHLSPGGFATVLCNWIQRREGEPEAPLAWVRESGCDAVVLRYGLDDPVAYAASWNQALRTTDPSSYEAALDRWLALYSDLGVRAVASGAVVLRRGAGGPQRAVALEALEAPTGPAGAQLERIFAALDLLAEGDEALLAARVQPAPGQAIEQTLEWTGAGYAGGGGLAVLEPGAGLAVEVDADLARRLGSGATVAEMLSGCEPRAQRAHLESVRSMLLRGILGLG